MHEPRFQLAPDLRFEWMSVTEQLALSGGRVSKPETLNYRTFKAEADGLFCEAIFGPNTSKGIDPAAPRPQKFGHVTLPVVVVHPWFLTRELSTLAKWCGRSADDVRRLSCYELFVDCESKEVLTETEVAQRDWEGDFAMGASAIRQLTGEQAGVPLFLDHLMVIAGQLRSMVPLEGGRFATSDVNDLYRRVINRANRCRRLVELDAPEIIIRNESRMVQEAVNALFDNERRPQKVLVGPGNRPLVSICGMLEANGDESPIARHQPNAGAGVAHACLTALGIRTRPSASRTSTPAASRTESGEVVSAPVPVPKLTDD